MKQLTRILICLFTFGVGLYLYIDKHNQQTKIKYQIPVIEREIEELVQQNTQLSFQYEHFKNPQNLIKLAQSPQYSHLKYPYNDQVMVITTKMASRMQTEEEGSQLHSSSKAKFPIYLGSRKK